MQNTEAIYFPHKRINVQNIIDHCPRAVSADEYLGLLQDERIFESVTREEVEATYLYDLDGVDEPMMEAITTTKARLERTMAGFVRALNRQMPSFGLEAQEASIGQPRKAGTVAVQVATIPVSDGQSLSVVFHSPSNDPGKITAADDLVAYRFLLNKRDVTHIVAPAGGRDISLQQTTLALTNLAARNSDKFQAKQAKNKQKEEELAALQISTEQISTEAVGLAQQVDTLGEVLESDKGELTRTKSALSKQISRNDELRRQLAALGDTSPVIDKLTADGTEHQDKQGGDDGKSVADGDPQPGNGDKEPASFTDHNAAGGALKAANPSLYKKVIEDVAVIHGIDIGEYRGYSRALFVSSLANSIKSAAKRDPEHARLALQFIKLLQAGYDKPVLTERHGVWSLLGEKEEPEQRDGAPTDTVRQVNDRLSMSGETTLSNGAKIAYQFGEVDGVDTGWALLQDVDGQFYRVTATSDSRDAMKQAGAELYKAYRDGQHEKYRYDLSAEELEEEQARRVSENAHLEANALSALVTNAKRSKMTGWEFDLEEDFGENRPAIVISAPALQNGEEHDGYHIFPDRDVDGMFTGKFSVAFSDGGTIPGGQSLKSWAEMKPLLQADWQADVDKQSGAGSEASGTLYWYGLQVRPLSIGAQPKGSVAYIPPESAQDDPRISSMVKTAGDHSVRHGAVAYDKELSPKEVANYELVDFGRITAAWGEERRAQAFGELKETITNLLGMEYSVKEIWDGLMKPKGDMVTNNPFYDWDIERYRSDDMIKAFKEAGYTGEIQGMFDKLAAELSEPAKDPMGTAGVSRGATYRNVTINGLDMDSIEIVEPSEDGKGVIVMATMTGQKTATRMVVDATELQGAISATGDTGGTGDDNQWGETDPAITGILQQLESLRTGESDYMAYLDKMQELIEQLQAAGAMERHEPYLHTVADRLTELMEEAA
ncbi:hypothetical protein [Aeromonas sp. Y311-2]|uniref:defense against restriction DarA-related protein n=1 Tax=Aeromonas sp. Y311-2 TaxID=2990507 RepID=UPI0022E6FD39|nr:hypothetical protein [Aeromonas sp. Y311-2]